MSSDETEQTEAERMEEAQKLKAFGSWIAILFDTAQAKTGGVVRRNKDVFLKHCTLQQLQDACFDKCFHLIETGEQYIVICNIEPLIFHC